MMAQPQVARNSLGLARLCATVQPNCCNPCANASIRAGDSGSSAANPTSTDAPHSLVLLCPRGHRPCRCATQQSNEFTASSGYAARDKLTSGGAQTAPDFDSVLGCPAEFGYCQRVNGKIGGTTVTKKIAVVAVLCAVVALVACRREEYRPLKLGGPVAEQPAR